MNWFCLNKKSHSICRNIKIFKSSEYIKYKICIFLSIHTKWIEPLILKTNFPNNSIILVKLPNSLRIRHKLKIRKIRIKLCLKCFIGRRINGDRIKKLTSRIMNSESKSPIMKFFLYIIQKITQGRASFIKRMIDFYKKSMFHTIENNNY